MISQSGAKDKRLILFSRREKKPFATKEKGKKNRTWIRGSRKTRQPENPTIEILNPETLKSWQQPTTSSWELWMMGEEEDLKKKNGIMNDARRRRRKHEAQKFEKREQNVPEIWTLLWQLRRNSRNPRLAVLFFFFFQSYGRLQGVRNRSALGVVGAKWRWSTGRFSQIWL